MSMKVVLPAPFGPMMARSSAGPMEKDRLLIARNPSKVTEMPETSRSALILRLLFLQAAVIGTKRRTLAVGRADVLEDVKKPADALGRKKRDRDKGRPRITSHQSTQFRLRRGQAECLAGDPR
jgi:hypothetical protein